MRKRIRIVAESNIPFLKGVMDDIARVDYLPWNEITGHSVRSADALITRSRTHCNRSLLEGSSVRLIATATIGFDHIDTGYCKRHGIAWTNAPGCNSSSVAQYVLSAMVALADMHQLDLAGLTIGIVGAGYVGNKVEKLSNALGMKVLLNDPPRERKEGRGEFTDLSAICRQSDIITLHVPLNMGGRDNTFHLVDQQFLNEPGKKSILINTSRGKVVDEKALKNAISKGRLIASALDVWEKEPGVDADLIDLVDIATSHIAGYSADGKANATAMSVQAVSRFFNLGLEGWFPAELPPPPFDHIKVEAGGKKLSEVLSEVVLKSYNIMRDDQVLRSAPDRFEQLRTDYPVRREAGVYRVQLDNDESGAGPVLRKLGFNILENNQTE